MAIEACGQLVFEASERLIGGERWIVFEDRGMMPVSEIGFVLHQSSILEGASEIQSRGNGSTIYVITKTLPWDLRPEDA